MTIKPGCKVRLINRRGNPTRWVGYVLDVNDNDTLEAHGNRPGRPPFRRTFRIDQVKEVDG